MSTRVSVGRIEFIQNVDSLPPLPLPPFIPAPVRRIDPLKAPFKPHNTNQIKPPASYPTSVSSNDMFKVPQPIHTPSLSSPTPSPQTIDKNIRKGGVKGRTKWRADETEALVQLIERRLPRGDSHWKELGKEYNEWATSNRSTVRDYEKLTVKFSQLRNYKKFRGW